MLCCFPRPPGRSLRTPRRETTRQQVRGCFTRPRSFRTLARNRPTAMGSTGQVSPAPAPRCPETRESPGKVSLGSATRHLEPLIPGQIGNQSTESLAGVCTVSTVQAGIPHTPVETLGQDFQDNKTRCTFSVFDSSVELKSQVHPQDELLQDHLVPPESSDEAPQVPAPAHDDVPPVELMPTATAAPSPALTPQQEPGPETPSPPAAELQLLVALQQVLSLELYLRPTLDTYQQFPSLTDLVIIVFIVTLIFQRQVNDRII
ncbi:microtubule-associated protein 6 [Heterocephalus glaber]|uniref:Microtubule-associated protein 6 n=1 Tax=Heterocephalus glaber TaxID=10181 RepID=A0AAX6PX27_HETGA|nr:microtubule-associated protein 6 [Heterocephalus glaber]